MVDLSTSLTYYKRPEICKAIVAAAADKEVAVKFGEKGFGRRPDILQFANDVLEFAKQGVTSFHSSEELWVNPLRLSPSLKRQELNELRHGWDLVLDIDCKHWEYSVFAADLLYKALVQHGINCVSMKFSGNHGFHLAVPFEAFPETTHDKLTKDQFPEIPRRAAEYLQEFIREKLSEAILSKYNINTIAESFDKKFEEIVVDNQFDPFKILDIDTVLISSRHMYRMPYSINEKSGLVSVPIDPAKVKEFKFDDAKPSNVKVNDFIFLDRTNVKKNEALQFLNSAFDFKPLIESDKKKYDSKYKDVQQFQQAVPLDFFPPCIHNILAGMEDGKKRAMFILVNTLINVGWNTEEIDKLLHEWNDKNPDQIRETILSSHIRYHTRPGKTAPPPNCANEMYYKGLHICTPDGLCARCKNPLQYIKKRVWLHNRNKKKEPGMRVMTEETKKKIQETKRKRKEFREEMKKKYNQNEGD